MLASIVSFVLSMCILFGETESLPLHFPPLSYLLAIAALTLFFAFVLIQILSWQSLQKMQCSFTPRASGLQKEDKVLSLFSAEILFFCLLSFCLAIDPLPFSLVGERTGFALWIFLFGISLDFLCKMIERKTRYIDPFYLLEAFTADAVSSIANDKETNLTKYIDAISEISLKAAEQRLSSLANSALSSLADVLEAFLQAAKSFAHKLEKPEGAGNADPVSFILFYTFQRIEIVFNYALAKNVETILSHTLHTLAKIAISCARYDLTFVPYPLHFIGKLAKQAVEQGFEEVGAKATLLLYETGKTILQEVDIQYQSLKEPIFSLTKQMEEITEKIFKKNRSIEIALLAKPFKDLYALFEEEKYKNHPDTALIQGDITRVLKQYAELHQAMHRIQNPLFSEKKEATEKTP